jgi:hypothetical protein
VVAALCVAATATASAADGRTRSPAAAGSGYGSLWVSRGSQNALVQYAGSASGSATPTVTISGAATGLSDPVGVTVDHRGDVFAVNAGNDSITEYDAGASGDVVPVATIAGANTGLAAPSSIAVMDDQVWISDPGTDRLEAFSVGSSGDVWPAETIAGSKTRLDNPVQIAASQDGFGIWVLNRPTSSRPSLAGYAQGAGNVAPTYRIAGKNTRLVDPTAIAVDSQANIEVAESASNAILRFDGWTTMHDEPPDDSISGSRTGIDQPDAVSVDALGHLSVANAGSGTLLVFAGKGYGNYPPTRTITGAGAGSSGIFVPAAPPSRPRRLHLDVRRHSVVVTWRQPRDTGGGLYYYQVCAAALDELAPICDSDVGPGEFYTHRRVSVGRLQDGVTYIFAVQAYNAIGESPLAGFKTAEPRGAPSPPQDLTVATTARTASMAWSKPDSNGGSAITGYRLLTSRCAAPHQCGTQRTTTTRHRRITLRRLIPGSRYLIKVKAINRYGSSPPETIRTTT